MATGIKAAKAHKAVSVFRKADIVTVLWKTNRMVTSTEIHFLPVDN